MLIEVTIDVIQKALFTFNLSLFTYFGISYR